MKTKPVPKTKYSTFNLNEATYLTLSGFRFETDGIIDNATCFVFDDTAALEKTRKEFWAGSPKVDLHRWLSVRQDIKYSLKGEVKVGRDTYLPREAPSPAALSPSADGLKVYRPTRMGEPYYYVEGKGIWKNLWGKGEPHMQRLRTNNCFYSREDASVLLARSS